MKVIVSGGGTGGHVYPALSIIEEVRKFEPGTNFLYIGTSKGIEGKIVPQANIPFLELPAAGINRKHPLQVLKGIVITGASFFRALKILRREKPDVIIGTGGYVSAPIIMAAVVLRKKFYLHEQNAIPGIVNRLFGRYAKAVFVSFAESMDEFPGAKQKVVMTGNPLRKDFDQLTAEEAKEKLGLQEKLILSVGGSGGAAFINELTRDMMAYMAPRKDFKWIHITGKRYYEAYKDMEASYDQLEVKEYLYDIPLYMKAADLMITRAGALTLSEISAAGIPAILIPSPHVANNHQKKNAEAFEAVQGAYVIEEHQYDPEQCHLLISRLLEDDVHRKEIGEQAKTVMLSNAGALIAARISEDL